MDKSANNNNTTRKQAEAYRMTPLLQKSSFTTSANWGAKAQRAAL